MALNLPMKRKSAFPGQQNSSAARKRAKNIDARSLAVQSSEAALSATGELDVAAYLKAREYEIRSLEAGIQKSKSALTSRAFQQVPRSLRRRTASHNVKRIPKRLRVRARREMIEDNTPTVTARRRKPTEIMRIRLETARRLQNLNSKTKAKRAALKAKRTKEEEKGLEEAGSHPYSIAPRVPKIKKNKLSRPPPPESKYKKRQRSKTWLPTHMFHAKRAHMTTSKDPLWRFAVPLSPTEKSYRPTHRASGARGGVAWDMSYISTIQLSGTETGLESVLKAVGIVGEEAWGVKGRKWRAGVRSLSAWVFESEGQRRPLAPVTLIRCAHRLIENMEMSDDDGNAGGEKANQKDKSKIFIRIHPSAFLQLWNELLRVSKEQHPPVMIEDLRYEVGSIEITGPGSTEALISSLRPLHLESKALGADSPEATWNALLGVSNPSSLPQNALLSFSVSDPRLQFPPRTTKPPSSEKDMQDLASLLSSWPSDRSPSPSALFDRRARLAAIIQSPSQKAINRRRSEAGPGQYPAPQSSDPKIPVIVLANRASSQQRSSNFSGSWTVLLPWNFVTPVWYSLMYYPLSSGGNLRFGGLKEQQQVAFEAGTPWFPGDFPGTRAGWEWGLREREDAKKEWERQPKGRRVEFDALDLGNTPKGEIGRGWACDWERLLNIVTPASRTGLDTSTEKRQDINTDDKPAEEAQQPEPPFNLYHLPTTQAQTALTNPSLKISDSALATVRINLQSRGSPSARARIYRLPTSKPALRQKWLSLASKSPAARASTTHLSGLPPNQGADDAASASQRLAASLLTPGLSSGRRQEHLPSPPEEDLIGFVTTGNYNLSEGKGTGIGSILFSKVRSSTKGAKGRGRGKHIKERNICIVRNAGESVGRLASWELV
ncbi:ribonucleases P/MRP protein subunit POP1-domain-containing protein [Aspergillus pseudodeflectus]|uniref:Ribonucleases P/MRP protein subunit POP1-domain-containing protein n=1 Tax=Aspergillus pseudodeflectus TaxID=176178 RepID=A0ABR4K1U3_9EURO